MVAGVQSNESLTESNDTFLVRWGVFVHNVKCKAHTEVRRMNNYEFTKQIYVRGMSKGQ